MSVHDPLDGGLLDDRGTSPSDHIHDPHGEEIWKGRLLRLFLGGIAASGNNVYKGGRYKLPEWHQLYGEFSSW